MLIQAIIKKLQNPTLIVFVTVDSPHKGPVIQKPMLWSHNVHFQMTSTKTTSEYCNLKNWSVALSSLASYGNYHLHIEAWWRIYVSVNQLFIESCNGMVGTKPLPAAMLTCQLNPKEYISMTFYLKFNQIHSINLHLKMSSARYRPSWSDLNVLTLWTIFSNLQ